MQQLTRIAPLTIASSDVIVESVLRQGIASEGPNY